MLKIGDKAPDFSLLDQGGNTVRLSDFRGKSSVVVFFYPKDFTPGCTTQSCSFRDSAEDFLKQNSQILGVSKDSSSSHKKFSQQYNLSYPLLTDLDGKVAKLFGVPKTLGFLDGRATFVIDKDGIVQMAFSSQLKTKDHARLALQAISLLK